MESKLRGYGDWMANDSNLIAGLNAWHWSDDRIANGTWLPSYGPIAVGLHSLPRTQALLGEIMRRSAGLGER